MEQPNKIPVRYLKNIGPKKAKALAKLGIDTVEDLLYHFPRRYEDRAHLIPISQLQPGSTYTVKAQVLAGGVRRSFRRRGFSVIEVAVTDDTGRIFCVWFNQPFLLQYLKPGTQLILYGKVDLYGKRLQMNSPEFEIISSDAPSGDHKYESLNINRVVPIYSLPESMGQRSLRAVIKGALDKYLAGINDVLPYDIRSRNNLLNLALALINIHFPDDLETQKRAYERLAFEEFFLFELPLVMRKIMKKEKAGIAHRADGTLSGDFIKSLPFNFTLAQVKVLEEIKLDMTSPHAMQRLLQGDVGSGKTVVAVVAALFAIESGYQVAFMAPTEILARQHYDKITGQFSQFIPGEKIKVELLTGSLNGREKEKIHRKINNGSLDLVIGTHALLREGMEFKKLGLVVIDEQHKFGVGQRALLPYKGINPDVLIMTATPIPRTLAITLYGDLDVSVIDELPSGRRPIETVLLSADEKPRAIDLAIQELKKGKQVYVVYPVIEESYALDIAGAKAMYEKLKAQEFKSFKVGLVHGKLKQESQDSVMLKFKNHQLDVLVSTTVLEVGIDIPEATCMIIEYAERFGLAQLHQLRGRVGRGKDASYCILISSAKTPDVSRRLTAMVQYSSGFRIAEEDLKIRGPGEFFGRRQSGLSELKIANPLTQLQLLKKAREEAITLLEADPWLRSRQNILLKEKLLQRFPEYEKLVMVG